MKIKPFINLRSYFHSIPFIHSGEKYTPGQLEKKIQNLENWNLLLPDRWPIPYFHKGKKEKKRRASRAGEVAVTARESWRLKPDVNASTRDVPMSHAPAPRGRFAISHPRVAGDEPDAVISGKKRLRSGAGATPMWPACCCCPSTGQSVQHISCHKTAWCLAVPLLLPSYCVLDEEYDY